MASACMTSVGLKTTQRHAVHMSILDIYIYIEIDEEEDDDDDDDDDEGFMLYMIN